MSFANIAPGSTVFIDANIFVYAFSGQVQYAAESRDLLDRIDRGEISGHASTHVLAETAHRLMTLEACTVYQWPFAGIAQRLRQHPRELQQLTAYRQAIEIILASPIIVDMPSPSSILNGADVSKLHGLLSNDALVVAVMQSCGLTQLASNDADFDRVTGITRYPPT